MEEKVVKQVTPRIILPQQAYQINYNLTPARAVELLPGSNPDIALWPEDKMGLWNGGKTGIVESATLPILWDKQSFSTAQGRQKQEASQIGFSWPVEIASLLLPENDPQRIRKELNDLGMWALVALRQSDEELWRHGGRFRPFDLYLCPNYFRFSLGCAGGVWDDFYALVGAPQE